MAKILLINSNRFKQPWPVIPFGLCHIAAVTEKAGHEVKVLDLCFSRNPAREISSMIKEFQPDVVGVSIRNIDNGAGFNTQFLIADVKKEVIEPLKKVYKGPIVIGGPAVSINPVEILDYLGLNFAIKGDGELSFLAFVENIQNEETLKQIKGLHIVKNGKIIAANEPWRVPCLDEIPFVNPTKYINVDKYRKFNSPLQIQTKRGCSLSCSYCTYNAIEGKFYRLKNPKKVVDEIEFLVKETGITHVEFTDSTFNIPINHCKNILKELKKRNLKLKLRTMGLNPGAVDEELIELMKEAGFMDVDLGAESGSNITLKTLGKNFTKKDIIKAGDLLKRYKIPTTWYLLVGAPKESIFTLKETYETLIKAASKWDLINIGIGLRVYNQAPVTKFISKKPEDNFLKPYHYEPEEISLNEVKIYTKWMALHNDNFFMYDEDENTPPFVLMLGSALIKIFAPRQPIWRLFILIRKIQRFTGITWLRKFLFLRKYRKIIERLEEKLKRENGLTLNHSPSLDREVA
ncbi:B12-binding domain-containing radical SAM protein [Thermodesulfatator indicus]